MSIEPADANGLQPVRGKEAIAHKRQHFQGMVAKIFSSYCEPVVSGNYFLVAMGMELQMNGSSEKTHINGIAGYEVRVGKITKEQFFY